MARTVGIGHQDFEEIRGLNNFYIDKTLFIKEWWENKDKVTLITRPRRFGKTLNMSMLDGRICLKGLKYGRMRNTGIYREPIRLSIFPLQISKSGSLKQRGKRYARFCQICIPKMIFY